MAKLSTRDHLIAVGLRLMQQNSYAATGVKEVLDVAGVPKGSFYHYFPSKEAFGTIVLQSYLAAESERSAKALKVSKAPPLKRLRRYFEQLIRVYGPYGDTKGGCLLGNLSQEMATHSEAIRQALQNGFVQWQAAVEEVLKEAVMRGELSAAVTTKNLAAFLLNSYEGALLRAKAEGNEVPLQLFLDLTFHTLLHAPTL